MPKGHAVKALTQKSETARDATNIFGIVRIRLFNPMIKSVKVSPMSNLDKTSAKIPNSRMTSDLLLDFKSFNMSSSCFFVRSICYLCGLLGNLLCIALIIYMSL